jgi:lactate dehydrogenase-like 2-hydroxyacid dehydrogenase
MTTRPAILIIQPHLAPLTGFLDSLYDVYRLWEGLPEDAENLIRAVVVTGEFELDRALLARLTKLELVACFTSGYDRIDVAWCHQQGLIVTHAPGVNHEDVADHAIGLLIASRRGLFNGDRLLRAGQWGSDVRNLSGSLKGQNLGIVGMGAIGQAVASRAESLHMVISWWGPRSKPLPWPRAESLLDLAKACDVLMIACKADDSNIGLISEPVIEAVGPQGLIINMARGQVIDEPALISALRSGKLGGAALDVFTHEPVRLEDWSDVPNTILTPHTAGATRESVQGMLMLLMQNLDAVFGGRPPVTPVSN